MSQFKKHIKIGLTLLMAAVFALNCGRSGGQTQFAKNVEADAGKAAPTYEEWVALVGQAKTDELYAGLGQDTLNLLSYGIGQSNMVQLINNITTTSKLVTLIGSDFVVGTGPGGRSGLGTVVTLYLVQQVDAQMQVNMSTNLVGGGAVPTDQDTIANLSNIINTLPVADVQSKLIDMFGAAGGNGFDLSRSLAVATSSSTANQLLYVQRMAKVVAHVEPTVATCAVKLCPLLVNMAAADVTSKMAPLIKGVTNADKLVETIQTTADITRLRALLSTAPVGGYTTIAGVTVANVTAKLVPVMNAVTDCTKMGYVVGGVTNMDTLVNVMNNVQSPTNLGTFLNLAENNSTWIGQVSPAENWGVPVKAAPFATAGAGAALTYTVAGNTIPVGPITFGGTGGTNYLPGVTTATTFGTCTGVQPVLHLNVLGGIIQTTGHYVVTAGTVCANGLVSPIPLTTPASSKTTMARLVDLINGLAPAATYYKILNLVDGVSSMTKMVQLVQDLKDANDVYDLLNNLGGVTTPGATCTVPNGSDNVSILAGPGVLPAGDIRAFIVGSQIAYISVVNPGTTSGITSATTFQVPGCTTVTYTAQISAGVITSMQVNNNMNNLTQVIELLGAANVPRLVQVMDGQRTFDNIGTQPNAALTTTYLGKMRVLMQSLNQGQEGPLKVGDLLNGVTNTDKIIDLIYDVTTTANLATVINGIFKTSEVPGCSDGGAGTFVGPSTVTASDTGTCENSGNGFFYGERDRAVTTLVYLVENVAASAKLVSLIENVLPSTKVVDLVNHVSTYSQHADGTPHVYPRGAVGLDAQAAGKRLAKIVDNTTTIAQLNFVTNNVTSIIKMSKLVSFMDIGATATDGVGKLPVLINAVTGANAYLSTTVPGRGNPTGNATGMGKMVNVIDYISGATTSAAMVQLKNLMNDINDINKMADLINQTVNSSNIVGLLNGVTDPRYGTSTTDLVTLLNNLPRGEISKMVNLVGEIGNANGTATATFPGPDHVLVAQLMAATTAQNVTPAVITAFVPASENITWTAHGFVAGDIGRGIIFSADTGGTMPAGLTEGQLYYLITIVDANNIRVSAVKGGATVDITSVAVGNITAYSRGVTTASGVGVTIMSQLIGSLGLSGLPGASGVTGGTDYTTAPTFAAGALNAGGGTGATGTLAISPALGTITRITLTNEGVCTVAPTAVTAVAGGGTLASFGVITAPTSASATNFKVKAVYITNGGSGYSAQANALTFNGTCSTAPVAASAINGVIGGSVTAGGANYTDSFNVSGAGITGGGGAGASTTALVAGTINTLASFYGGAGYVTGQICPIVGAGGSGGTCTVTAAGGVVSACSALTGGTGYIDNQIVTIGGAAKARATVVAGAITGFTIDNSGCGYVGAPSVRVLTGTNECAVAGAAHTAVLTAGRVTSITLGAGWTGCPANPTVIIGDNPYVAYGDGASAIVNNVTAGTGQVVAFSFSPAADNLAQLLVNTEKAPGDAAINYNGTAPNISAREAMVRLINNGVYHTSAGYQAAFASKSSMGYPGIGPVHIAQNVLGNLSSAGSVMTVINLLNSDSTSMTDMITLIGCGDHVENAVLAPLTDNDFHNFCSQHAPTLW